MSAAVGQRKETAEIWYKSKVDLVLVPAVVTQHDEPVRGLTAKDFVLLHDDKPEKVAFFEEIEAVPAKVQQVVLPPHTAQNYAPADSRQDVVIVLLDFLNATFSTAARIRSCLAEVTQQFAETHTPVTLLVLNHQGLVQAHSFTSDMENLTKAVKQWSSHGLVSSARLPATNVGWATPTTPTTVLQATTILQQLAVRPGFTDSALLDARTKAGMTLDAVEQIAEAYRGIPGRKKLIWMSTGFPGFVLDFQTTSDTVLMEFQIKGFQIEEKTVRAWKALSHANIAVYPIDSNGVTIPTWEGHFSPANVPNELMPPTLLEAPSNIPSLLEVARRTGGVNCDLAPPVCVQRVQADATRYYVLGFYLRGDSKLGWHKLKVTVNQPSMAVRARDGFVVGDISAPAKETSNKTGKNRGVDKEKGMDKDAILTALASPLDYTAVPLRLQWSKVSKQGTEIQVELMLTSPPGGIAVEPVDTSMNVDVLAFIRPAGKTEGRSFPKTLAARLSPEQQKSLATAGFLFRKRVTLTPGRYEVRVMLRDNVAHKIGTVSTALDLTDVSTSQP